MNLAFNSKPYRVVLMFLFIFSNIVACIYYIYSGCLGGDLLCEYMVDTDLMLLSLFYVIASFVFLMFFLSPICIKIANSLKSYGLGESSLSIHYLFLFISLFYFFSVVFYNVGLAGSGWKQLAIPKYIMYLNAIISPSYLILIYIFSQLKATSKVYYINIALYAITILARGFTNPFIYLFVAYLLRMDYFGKPINTKKLTLLLLAIVFFYPIVRVIKTIIIIQNGYVVDGSGNQDAGLIFQQMVSTHNGPLDLYFAFLFVSFERLQHVANVQFLLSNINEFRFFLSGLNVSSFYADSWFYRAIGQIIDPTNSWNDIKTVYGSFAQFIRSGEWNAQLGFVGWMIIYPELTIFYLLYIFLGVLASYVFSRLNCFNGFLTDLTWCVLLLLVAHGWIWDIEIYLQSMIVFFVINLLINKRMKLE